MSNSIYQINRGINKSVEFKGLRAQYIGYLGLGILGLLIAFGIMHIIGIPALVTVPIVILAATGMVFKVYSMSAKYGEYGMQKEMAKRNIPKVVKCNNRTVFRKLKSR
jgi:ATP/ADP translocase